MEFGYGLEDWVWSLGFGLEDFVQRIGMGGLWDLSSGGASRYSMPFLVFANGVQVGFSFLSTCPGMRGIWVRSTTGFTLHGV